MKRDVAARFEGIEKKINTLEWRVSELDKNAKRHRGYGKLNKIDWDKLSDVAHVVSISILTVMSITMIICFLLYLA